MVKTRKDFFIIALGVASFIVGLVLIGNYIPFNWWVGGLGILLVVLGVFLLGLEIGEKTKR